MHIYQTTINRAEKVTGIGLHSGKNVTIKIKPAPVNSGITFIRKDLNNFSIKAISENVVDTRLSTVIGRNGNIVQTVEHFMSALSALGIDNLIIEVDGPEMPIMDGSSIPFIYLIKEAGIRKFSAKKRYIHIKNKIEIKDHDKKVSLLPSNQFKISFFLDYKHPLIDKQFFEIDLSKCSYVEEISRARTFGFLEDVESLRKMNLALGGSLDNAVVISGNKILNKDGLRYHNEFVRHKILDAIGDLYLLGHPIIGSYSGFKAGHDLNSKLCSSVLASNDFWEFVEMPDKIYDRSFNPFYDTVSESFLLPA